MDAERNHIVSALDIFHADNAAVQHRAAFHFAPGQLQNDVRIPRRARAAETRIFAPLKERSLHDAAPRSPSDCHAALLGDHADLLHALRRQDDPLVLATNHVRVDFQQRPEDADEIIGRLLQE